MKKRKARPALQRFGCGILAVAFAAAIGGCTPNQRIIDSAKTPEPSATEKPQVTGFVADLETMRTADYTYIYVFRRKDGTELDSEDKKFINSQKPLEVNRVRLSDNGRAVIFGSNFRLPPEVLKNLTDIYAFEDYSKGVPPTPASNEAVLNDSKQ